jgi:ABC-type polysaccharide/polyol phosphate export permease
MTITTELPNPNEGLRSLSSTAAEDLLGGLRKVELWGRIGWLDVKRRYRRTIIGPFWSTITLAVYIGAVGLVGAGLWNKDISSYLPYLSSGMIVWTLISTIIIEACTLLVVGHALFRNVRFDYSILAYALVWRNFVIFAHNFAVYFVLTLVLQPHLLSPVELLAIPGLALVLVNGVWIGLLVSMFCLRYRDVQQIIQTFIQIMMLVTPIFWSAENLGGIRRLVFVQLNPIYRLIDVVRAPLLGEIPTVTSYLAVGIITIVGWTVTVFIFQRFRRRISYWS